MYERERSKLRDYHLPYCPLTRGLGESSFTMSKVVHAITYSYITLPTLHLQRMIPSRQTMCPATCATFETASDVSPTLSEDVFYIYL